ncbi:MAG: cadmium-translocating P-type ATPase [Clostridia bacterium]|nr:cadmium-translocating P-type ATPase [Clostridia bacterium]
MKRKHKIIIARIAASVVLTAAVYVISLFNDTVFNFWVLLIPYLLIGYDILWTALRNISRGQIFDENFLMTIATVGAFAIGEYYEAVGVMIFYQVGELFQSIAVGKSRKSIAALMDIRPTVATVLRNGEEITLAPEDIEVGEIIVVRPGEKIALDGEIIEGSGTLNLQALTGESLPVDKFAGDKAVSGAVNMSGVLKIRVSSLYRDSTVSRILELVEESSAKKAKTENFITKFAKYYTPCVVIGAVLLAVLPPLVLGLEWGEWIRRALVFLMVSCPCALVVSVPLSFFGGIGGASRMGILIKGANYIDVLSKVDTVVFDKTGTLTRGSFEIAEIYSRLGTPDDVLGTAAHAETFSTHPIARAVAAAYKGETDTEKIKNFTETAGKGVRAEIDGKLVCVGNAALLSEEGISFEKTDAEGTVLYVSRGGEYLGYILIKDVIKEGTAEAVRSLKKHGIKKTVMLTGDAYGVAREVAERVGVDETRAELLPDGKVAAFEELISDGRRVAFVGDGINDAPVLSRADVGIAMGALGSDAAIEAADVVIMDDKLSHISDAIRISKKTMGIVRQNIIFALAVKGLILLLGALGLVGMWIAVFGDVGVMVIAVLNSMRTMGRKTK